MDWITISDVPIAGPSVVKRPASSATQNHLPLSREEINKIAKTMAMMTVARVAALDLAAVEVAALAVVEATTMIVEVAPDQEQQQPPVHGIFIYDPNSDEYLSTSSEDSGRGYKYNRLSLKSKNQFCRRCGATYESFCGVPTYCRLQ